MPNTIQTADLDWQCVDGIEVPVSKQFGDVYFSKDNGLLETRHVFLNGNDLSTRLADLHDFEYFTVAETGFGTGLNILALWQLWQQVRPDNHSHLHAISVEKFPLSKTDLIRALNAWDELKPLADQLIQQYPLPLAGCHRLNFPSERFSIDLWLGDAQDVFPIIPKTTSVNAWFLDGFAPACNPDLWAEHIFNHVVRLSDYGTSFASFSVAGVLKRALKQHGISISRPKGFGHKREMLKAIWIDPETQSAPHNNDDAKQHREVVQQKSKANATQHDKQRYIAIIGAGIAGLSCAWAFAERGHQVSIYDQSAPLVGASGNPLALLNPKLSPIAQSADHLMTLSWQFAQHYYPQFKAFRAISVQQLIQKNLQEALDLVNDYSSEVLEYFTAEQLDLQTHYASVQLKQAGAISPQQLRDQILAHDLIDFKIAQIEQCQKLDNKQVQLLDVHKNILGQFDHVVVCCARESQKFFSHYPRLRAIRGQVSWLKNTGLALNPQHAYSFGGYCMQLDAEHLILGASFHPECDDSAVAQADHVHNYELIHNAFPAYAEALPQIDSWQGRASVRAQTLDYFPVLGQGVDDLEMYSFAGLGSKGFLFAPLCSEILAALVLKEACPISQNLLNMLSPTRGRKKIRVRKPYYQAPQI
ncbi:MULTISPECIES: FAD-dependent 5-carboxymethylaminomethyl-2-thiouridine(34) oxidoreductase MnmC [Acinetobacter]|uniref:tRNA 5-methylaminomethyl-2-thiouridine biosynthesis bifunctional protein MnmC n=1 Tax=Acinetobacter piscicola TaxID=2006115 RepID=A0A7S6VU49_9GAMM|nr:MULTISPECIES: FAD-dependent 5-carboxymethylaminomethyl-2-thiouridine(34) oxidoreductase MnmC [Acinetobacter]QOW44965.1 FAD-dependent 5-carboxymethylaminomethyl-2-thiouridine(34) oxidoreductase MnmC [Acinetobacter piscicola]